MSKSSLNNIQEEEILDEIFDNEIIIFEDIQGSKIWCNWNGSEFTIKPRSLSNDAINLIDLAMQNYYNPALNYFKSMGDRVCGLMPKNWWFCFEYFPDSQPANIEYQRMPKNGLVLVSIFKNGKYECNVDEIDEYSRLFSVDALPVIFEGKLTQETVEAIKYFLNTSEKDLEYVFGEKSFAFFFYKILNPRSEGSFLMENEFQHNLEKIVLRVKGREASFDILNPLYQRVSGGNSTEFTEIYSLILINFLSFCQSIDLESIKIKGNRRDEAYIYLMCKLFNIYVSDVKDDLINFDFVVPQFFDKDKFKINKDLIGNKLTIEYISESDKLEYIFKCILGSFNKKRKRPIGLLTDNTVILMNNFIDEINSQIDKSIKKMRERDLVRGSLMDFSDFFSIEYDQDGSGDVYPDVWDSIEKSSDSKKKGIAKIEGKPPGKDFK